VTRQGIVNVGSIATIGQHWLEQWNFSLSDTCDVVSYLHHNALGTGSVPAQGGGATISVSGPTIRPDPSAQFTYHRVFAREPITANITAFVESGWIKDGANGNCPRVYWTYEDITGHQTSNFATNCGYLQDGPSYNFQVRRTNIGTWSMYWVDLLNLIQTGWVGLAILTEFGAGGETPITPGGVLQGMGDSHYRSTQWLDATGSWHCACGYQIYNDLPATYTLTSDPDDAEPNWEVSGNNQRGVCPVSSRNAGKSGPPHTTDGPTIRAFGG
jgi:hypothetical protein